MHKETMMKKILKYLTYLFSIVALIFIIESLYSTVYALSKYGSRGNEVKQIQTKLKNWGY